MIKKILSGGLLLLAFGFSNAQVSGAFDPTFGNGGKVVTNISQANFNVLDQAVQADGKIVMVGQCNTSRGNMSGFIARTNADGTPDTSFYLNGKQRWDVSRFTSVAVQPDGKILVGGAMGSLFRFNSNGTVDANYQLAPGFDPEDLNKEAAAIAMQPDGKILGLFQYPTTSGSSDFKVFRYNVNGSLDTSFNGSGYVLTSVGTYDRPKSIALDANGKIVVGGDYYNDASTNKFFYVRYNSNGTLDTTFNTTGKAAFGFANITYTESFGITIQADGKIVNGGLLTAGQNGVYLYMVRLTANGALDSFGDGNSYSEFLPYYVNNGHQGRIKSSTDGKITMSFAEDVNSDNNNDAVFKRFSASGVVDLTFGTAGTARIDLSGLADGAADFDFTAANQILFSGNALQSFLQNDLAMARLNSNGTLDTSFSGDGKAMIHFTDAGDDSAKCIARQPDGKILVGGSSFFADWDYFSLARYNANGTLDPSFANGSGVAVIQRIGHVSGIAVDANGKIVLVGNDSSMYALRLNPDGTLDTTFGTNGINDFGSLSFGGTLEDVAIRPNGKIVMVGSLGDFTNGDSDFMVAQLNADGTFDNTFGTAGISKAGSFVGGYEQFQAVKLQPDGKIVAGGSVYNGATFDMIVSRYNNNGTLDNSFNGNGTTTYSSGNSALNALTLQADGKIVVTGQVDSGMSGLVAIRFTGTGALDTTFGTNGLAEAPGNVYNTGQDIAIMDNQKIVVIGTGSDDIHYAVSAARFDQNGIVDASFGNGGSFATSLAGDFDVAEAGLIAGNSIFIAATAFDTQSSTGNFAIGKFFLDTVLGTNVPMESRGPSFYPNPAKNQIAFDSNVSDVTIITLDGKSVKASVYQNTVDVSGLPAGSYIVSFKAESGELFRKKLIKQ